MWRSWSPKVTDYLSLSTLLSLSLVRPAVAWRLLNNAHHCVTAPEPAARVHQVEPKYLTITNYHVVAANDESVYVWQFRTSFSKVMSTDVTGVKRKDTREKVFHVDDPNPAQVGAPTVRVRHGRLLQAHVHAQLTASEPSRRRQGTRGSVTAQGPTTASMAPALPGCVDTRQCLAGLRVPVWGASIHCAGPRAALAGRSTAAP